MKFSRILSADHTGNFPAGPLDEFTILITYRFKSNYFKNGLGFKLVYGSKHEEPLWTYRSGSCGGSFTTPNGVFTSPLYPELYPDDADCIYNITQPSGTFILLQISSLNIPCFDYLEIRDGPFNSSHRLHKLCGHYLDVPTPIISTQNNIWMR